MWQRSLKSLVLVVGVIGLVLLGTLRIVQAEDLVTDGIWTYEVLAQDKFALTQRKEDLAEIRELARESRGRIKQIYLHWTAGSYDHTYDDYHLNITGEGKIVLTCTSFLEFKPHTWQRNDAAIGISICCGRKATVDCKAVGRPKINFQDCPPTAEQLNTLAQVVALITYEWQMPISPSTVITHYEAAEMDGYGPRSKDKDLRWDLWYVNDYALTDEMVLGGDLLRAKASYYRVALGPEKPLKDETIPVKYLYAIIAGLTLVVLVEFVLLISRSSRKDEGGGTIILRR